MKVLMAGTELHPVAKAGGLADMIGGLSAALGRLGAEVRCALPAYRDARLPSGTTELDPIPVEIDLWGQREGLRVRRFEGGGLPGMLWLVEHAVFERDGLYDDPATREGYPDNGYRWALFCRAVHAALGRDGFVPEVVHGHDHQAGPLLALLRWAALPEALRSRPGLVLTIHNLEYQGLEPRDWLEASGLPASLARPLGPAEYYGRVNLLKLGIEATDVVTTVSPRYAREIRTPELGVGLQDLLAGLGDRVVGILNGIDVDTWNPAVDPHLPVRYTRDSFTEKTANREKLCAEMEITPGDRRQPLLGWVGRLTSQKGVDLLLAALDAVLGDGVPMVLLGSGEERYERALLDAARRWPGRLAVRLGFDEGLAHRVEGGADAFLMPSRYEPCGLNQMYSLRYGTVPVVREVGGLADTVVDADRDPVRGNGFTFAPYDPWSMLDAVRRAAAAFADPERWRTLALRGMAADFSWDRSAERYRDVYREALRVETSSSA